MGPRRSHVERDTYDTALSVLASRAHSTSELRQKLLKKNFEPADVVLALDRLAANGLLDDDKFASAFARARLTSSHPPSVRRVRQELLRRGIASDTAARALEAVVSEEEIDESEGLDVAARKKLASMQSLDPVVQRRRLFSYLARRGYALDDVTRIVDRLLRSRL